MCYVWENICHDVVNEKQSVSWLCPLPMIKVSVSGDHCQKSWLMWGISLYLHRGPFYLARASPRLGKMCEAGAARRPGGTVGLAAN